ncbi:hypothetical protein [Sulfurimonas sp. NW9]|uniref:hypothetical protein n=1 Tax=Sulfurimonas sp. NW9 TaxID=2922728 RepID=UPI003DA81426
MIKDKKSTTEELKEAVELILKYYGKIPQKLGMRAHPKFEIYSELILRICHHPNVNKDIIIKLDKELHRRNPEYALELDDSLTKVWIQEAFRLYLPVDSFTAERSSSKPTSLACSTSCNT